MSKIMYVPKKFRASSLEMIDQANDIIEEYRQQGFSMTLRQLYYQFVARDFIPNNMKSYNRLKNIINDARLAGEIDWDSIEDRTRNLEKNAHWDSPRDILSSCATQYAVDKWKNQKHYLEVWIEKEALIGVVEPICRQYDVPYFACRGYTSQSEQWRAGMRLGKVLNSDRKPIILHLGDHDPSGIDMTRDNDERLDMFTEGFGPNNYDDPRGNVQIKRLALNMDQIRKYNPPANPAKQTDSRFEKYIREYGDESWELDALSPAIISDLIEENILDVLDQDKWDESIRIENKCSVRLQELADDWEDEE